jgi:hypothetical protein
MESIFDIFRRFPDGKPLGIESAKGLRAALGRLAHLASATPGDYFIYSEKTGGVIDFEQAMDDAVSPRQHHRAA